MNGRQITKSSISLLAVLFLSGLLVGPAQASHDHENNVIIPLATGIVLGSIFFRSQDHHHYYSKRRYASHSGHYRHDSGHRRYKHYSQSRSYGGYSRRSDHRGYQPGHGGTKHHSKRKQRH